MKPSILVIPIVILMACNYLQAENKQAQSIQNVYKHSKEELKNKCDTCHDMREGNKYFHMPVKIGTCTACHNVNTDTKDLLRIKESPEMCILCHSAKRATYYKDKYQHPAIKQKGCTGCHDPHSGERKFRLKHDKRKDLCLSCHTEKKEWISSVKNKHGAIFLEDGGCFFCHDPHGTNRPKMLKAPTSKDLCLSCHNKPLKRDEDGKMLLNMKEHLDNNSKWHGPIITGNCVGCHNPHGSNNHRMLKGPYPSKSIAKFKPESYFCFICHDSEKITQASTTTFTNFRRNDKNLHTIHVKKSSIVCGTCHEFHAVKKQIPLLKEKTTFAGTKFSLNYIKNIDGGSCNPICHNKREYKRGIEARK
ncbi:hypothetical protein HUE87_06195 [Candidatus Sulfurimonas marisnigri]|uniref:Doubled CXXCH motif domain-containing protein n=1 Tax=Candidatus Sulfurimonas marisnigri TaxID=2740405 RepID=A0A7S7RQV1_9BACT|nr:cytochrome c3 family protein [Candidatus Sulfurimonas marisnigri]QOY55812.1 hypothetical protein HUE87_06195 [Candidatus Sulfurimonas marisnigri]